MEGQKQMPPELEKALRAYELAMRDGGQAEQATTYENLLRVQTEMGGAAVVAFFSTETPDTLEQAG